MDRNCLIGFITLSLVILGIVAMFLNYKVKFERKNITLEKNDKQHEQKHHLNETRIKELEKKNGAEQRQINELQEKVKDLEGKLPEKQ